MIKVLADYNATLSLPDRSGSSPLHLAASLGRRDCVTELFLCSSELRAEDKDAEGFTPFLRACQLGMLACAREIASRSEFATHACDEEGNNAAHWFCLRRSR
eukprot:269323-Hanusia_phi.AAC.1